MCVCVCVYTYTVAVRHLQHPLDEPFEVRLLELFADGVRGERVEALLTNRLGVHPGKTKGNRIKGQRKGERGGGAELVCDVRRQPYTHTRTHAHTYI